MGTQYFLHVIFPMDEDEDARELAKKHFEALGCGMLDALSHSNNHFFEVNLAEKFRTMNFPGPMTREAALFLAELALGRCWEKGSVKWGGEFRNLGDAESFIEPLLPFFEEMLLTKRNPAHVLIFWEVEQAETAYAFEIALEYKALPNNRSWWPKRIDHAWDLEERERQSGVLKPSWHRWEVEKHGALLVRRHAMPFGWMI
jgi:hypothetical protein